MIYLLLQKVEFTSPETTPYYTYLGYTVVSVKAVNILSPIRIILDDRKLVRKYWAGGESVLFQDWRKVKSIEYSYISLEPDYVFDGNDSVNPINSCPCQLVSKFFVEIQPVVVREVYNG